MDIQAITQSFIELVSYAPANSLQFYGLLFLLGSFTVASLSDIKRMAAQKEFAQVWLVFIAAVFLYDFYRIAEIHLAYFTVKWILIGLFALVSWRHIGIVLSLSEMDVTAACAVMSLLAPLLVACYYLVLVVFNILLKPALRRFGDGISMPFMPVVFAATVVMLIIARLPDVLAILKELP
jgi:hypothetical protein